MTALVVRFEIILPTHATNNSNDYVHVPVLIFLPALH